MYTEKEMLNLNPKLFLGLLSEREILEFFYSCNAYWIDSGDPVMPHAKTTRGMCTNAYFDCGEVLKYPFVGEILAYQVYLRMREFGFNCNVDMVIGSPYSSITFSCELAKHFRARHGFARKDPLDPEGKKMIWKGGIIPSGTNVLQAEELITTRWSLDEVRRAVLAVPGSKPNFLSVVACIVHRPRSLSDDCGVDVTALIEREVWTSKPEDCNRCRDGSKRLEPRGNWAELLTGIK